MIIMPMKTAAVINNYYDDDDDVDDSVDDDYFYDNFAKFATRICDCQKND